jgi:hypothetical protein
MHGMSDQDKNQFEKAGHEKETSLLGEFYAMLMENKKYWMIPIVLVLLAFGALILLGGRTAAPFIYTLF